MEANEREGSMEKAIAHLPVPVVWLTVEDDVGFVLSSGDRGRRLPELKKTAARGGSRGSS